MLRRKFAPKILAPGRRGIRSGYLYVFALREGVYKIGRTNDLIGRAYNHQQRFGGGGMIYCLLVNDVVAVEKYALSKAWSYCKNLLTKELQSEFASKEVFAMDVPDIFCLYIQARYVFATALLAPELEAAIKNSRNIMCRRFITENIERRANG